jgi:hypothetical protein
MPIDLRRSQVIVRWLQVDFSLVFVCIAMVQQIGSQLSILVGDRIEIVDHDAIPVLGNFDKIWELGRERPLLTLNLGAVRH